jgi:phosphatidylinositol-4-phosphate 3-kinase
VTDEKDLISFNSVDPMPSQKTKVEDPYSKLKQEILQISANQTPQNNLQMMPYVKPPQPSLTPESLKSLYSMNNPINQIQSQHTPYPNYPSYPAIGFSHFMQQPNYNHYQYQNYYQSSNNSQVYWSSISSSAASSSSIPQRSNNSTPTLHQQPSVMQQQQSQQKERSSIDNLSSTSQSSQSSITKTEWKSCPNTSKKMSGDNLIDLDVEDSKDSSNILQTFDPLSSNRNSTEEAEKTFYSDQDPFDYIYSGGTQYSDPVYDAIVRSEYSYSSSKPQTPHDDLNEDQQPIQKPPPLPPRNSIKPDDTYSGSVQSFQRKLYENVTHHKKFDRDMLAFYTMVKELRSQYNYDDIDTNIGHIIAAEIDSGYTNVSSIKLLVYPSKECFQNKLPDSQHSQENYEKLDGYINPIVFTCDINSNVMHVILHVLVVLEGEISGSPEDFCLKTIGSQEWLSPNSSLGRLEYIQTNIKLEKDILLGLLPKQEKYMKVLARTHQDDARDEDIKFENILPKESYSAISYDNLMILLETLEMEIDKLESSSNDYQTVHSSGVVQAVKAICALLGCIDTLELFNAINDLKDACSNRPTKPKVSLNINFSLVNKFLKHLFTA